MKGASKRASGLRWGLHEGAFERGLHKVSGLHEGGFEGGLREVGLRRLRKRGFEAEGDLITIVVVLKFSLAQWF